MGKSKTSFEPGNKASEIHGGEAGVKAIRAGNEFTGLAAAQAQDITNELEREGVSPIVKRTAIRLQTVADLYYQAILGAAEEGDLVKLDRYVQRFGWLAGSALRAWAQVGEETKRRERVDVVDVLATIKGESNGGNS